MPRLSLQLTVSAVVAVLVGGSLYRFVGDVGLASVTGVVWGSGIALAIHLYRATPSMRTAAWEHGRWVGVGIGLANLAALVGVSPSLPLSTELRLGLGILVVGTGFVGVLAGSLAEVARTD